MQVADGVTVTEVSQLERTTQSGVSRALARLEAEIGTALLHRSGRTLRMTHAGAAFKHHVDAMMHELDDGLAAVSQVIDPATGTVTLAFQPSLGSWLVPQLLSSFRDQHPGVLFDLRPNHDELVSSVQHRTDVDLELSTVRPGNPTAEWTPLMREQLKLAAPVGHDLAARSHVRLAELSEEMFISISEDSALHQQSTDLYREAGFEPVMAFECHDLASVHGFVAAGLGLGIVPAPRGGPSEEFFGGLRLLDITDVYAFREIGLAWSSSRRLLPAAGLFRAHVLDRARAGELIIDPTKDYQPQPKT